MQQLSLEEQTHAVWDRTLIDRYDLAGPRYTSYPTAPQFREEYGQKELLAAYERSNAAGSPLSLYFHIPFCSRVCYYCACNKIVTADRSLAAPYLERVAKEIAMQAGYLDTDRPVRQLHWGGGTPTYISDDEKRFLMRETRKHFRLLEDDSGEYSIEVHPGDTNVMSITCLRELGFNRLSMGVQDFNSKVQAAVNRHNSVEEVQQLVKAARQEGFHSISMDLIYGLPYQSWETYEQTLDDVIELSPDRLSIFNYAHLPHLFKVQKQMDENTLPTPDEKLRIMEMSTHKLLDAGYVFIGMDHFAKPDDELAVAQRQGKLQRNFQGYSTHGDCDLLAFGVSAISGVGRAFAQNHKQIDLYNAAVDAGRLPVARGIDLTEDDLIRAKVIEGLICHFQLEFARIEQRFGIDFQQYFAEELGSLKQFSDDGLVTVDEAGIQVTAAGRLLIRRICMAFDAYLKKPNREVRYSKII